MEENYTYPVIFDFSNDDVIEVKIPNFSDNISFIEIDDDKIAAAQDILAMAIIEYEDKNLKLPEPSKFEEIKLLDNQQLIFVNIWLPYYRAKIKINYVKKNLTIPAWLDQLAKQRNVNYSALLVKALKEELHIK
ncbi:type II toxin-antitoxin system HicB family antitoxin [Clostridium chromiireducens]|uniref:Type II toxin-antitoxin system HicB family antitoxin n=1 Tax=Clostridium chromiireducens TaxID=225345 RepID=A0A964RSD2_9CLOT|nr:type II toxin-antitoxin system HicB family antitoxin [Clostridium chromiireducens]MVX66949.1 type II toxin-antitoxin system HicB family antitoxin [Clostridium chromiireducens]